MLLHAHRVADDADHCFFANATRSARSGFGRDPHHAHDVTLTAHVKGAIPYRLDPWTGDVTRSPGARAPPTAGSASPSTCSRARSPSSSGPAVRRRAEAAHAVATQADDIRVREGGHLEIRASAAGTCTTTLDDGRTVATTVGAGCPPRAAHRVDADRGRLAAGRERHRNRPRTARVDARRAGALDAAARPRRTSPASAASTAPRSAWATTGTRHGTARCSNWAASSITFTVRVDGHDRRPSTSSPACRRPRRPAAARHPHHRDRGGDDAAQPAPGRPPRRVRRRQAAGLRTDRPRPPRAVARARSCAPDPRSTDQHRTAPDRTEPARHRAPSPSRGNLTDEQRHPPQDRARRDRGRRARRGRRRHVRERRPPRPHRRPAAAPSPV